MSWMLPAEGRLPVLAEPVRAEVRVTVPGSAVIYALDPTGKRRDRVTSTIDAGAVVLDPGAARSIWFEITVQ